MQALKYLKKSHMKSQEKNKSDSEEFRLKAEEELNNRKVTKTIGKVDHQKLIHELQVHQIELQMQNEELTRAREQAEASMEKYTDLYDFAPSGYLSLSEEGSIVDLNFLAANILAKDRAYLKNTRFGLYVSQKSMKLFNEFFEQVFHSKQKQTSELLLLSTPEKPTYVHIDALVSQSSSICLLTMIDISERKAMEVELQKALHQYKELNSYFLGREMRIIDLKEEINELLIKSGCEKEYLI